MAVQDNVQQVQNIYSAFVGMYALSAGPNNDMPALFDYMHVSTLP